MKPHQLISILGIFLLFLFSSQAQAMRCGTQLVLIGDSEAKVLQNCGKPTERIRVKKCTDRYSNPFNQKTTVHSCRKFVYDRGAQDFIYEITFANYKVINITTHGYGR